MWLVSKCGPKVQARTRRWLQQHAFAQQTGVPIDHLRFCLQRPQKADHARQLQLTHFIDDRLDVLTALRGLVPSLLLFGPQRRPISESGGFGPLPAGQRCRGSCWIAAASHRRSPKPARLRPRHLALLSFGDRRRRGHGPGKISRERSDRPGAHARSATPHCRCERTGSPPPPSPRRGRSARPADPAAPNPLSFLPTARGAHGDAPACSARRRGMAASAVATVPWYRTSGGGCGA